MLKVKQVSKTLAAGMMYRSYGNPGWLFILLKKLKDESKHVKVKFFESYSRFFTKTPNQESWNCQLKYF